MEVPTAWLRLTVQSDGPSIGVFGAELSVDGHSIPVHCAGTRDIAIMSGRHRLQMSVWWLRRYGKAETMVDVEPGQVVSIYYAPPHSVWGSGEIGVTPQKRKGLAAMIATITGFLGVVFVIVFVVLPAIVFLSDA